MCKILHVACFTCINLKTHHIANVTLSPENFQKSHPTYVTPIFLFFTKIKWNDLNATSMYLKWMFYLPHFVCLDAG